MATEQDAYDLWNAFQADPRGTYAAVGRQLESMGIDTAPEGFHEMRAFIDATRAAQQEEAELAVYDATVDALLAQAPNQDIDKQSLHGFIAAAEGDYLRGIQLYRADEARRTEAAAEQLKRQLGWSDDQFNAMRRQAPPTAGGAGYERSGDPTADLHRAIEAAAAMSRR